MPHPDETRPQCIHLGGDDIAVLFEGRLTIFQAAQIDSGAFIPAAQISVAQFEEKRSQDGALDRLADLLRECGFGARPKPIDIEMIREQAVEVERQSIAAWIENTPDGRFQIAKQVRTGKYGWIPEAR